MELSIEGLKNEGYKYLFIPKRSRKTFYVTKAKLNDKGTFKDTSTFYEYKTETKLEEEILKVLPKGILLKV